eukprot:COSAG03_NODE_25200_length_267_cov_0.613095_1_plen_32_part_10
MVTKLAFVPAVLSAARPQESPARLRALSMPLD